MDQTGLAVDECSRVGAVSPGHEAHDLEMEELQLRANAYGLLATLLAAPPSADVIDVLQKIDSEDPAIAEQGAMGAAWQLLRSASDRFSLGSIDDEYHTLFIGVGRGEMVPFGSWYMTGFLMEKPLSLLRNDLQQLGIERQEGVFESEDHIAALFETMATIIASGKEISWDTQRDFFLRHIEPWATKFFDDLLTAEAARFYRAVANLGHSFIEIEKQYLSMSV